MCPDSDSATIEPAAQYPEIQPGLWTKHPKFGFGLVKERVESGEVRKADFPQVRVDYPGLGSKWLVLRYARLEVVEGIPREILRELTRTAPVLPEAILPVSANPHRRSALPGRPGRGSDRETAARLAAFFRTLAERIEQGRPCCPAEFQRLAGSGLSELARLHFRLWFLGRLCFERSASGVTAWRAELRLFKHLLKQRMSAEDADDRDLTARRAEALANTFREAQPASRRIWVHATRRKAPDRGLLWAESIAQFLAGGQNAGYLDYTLVQDWVCIQPDLRYRFTQESMARLHTLAGFWDRYARHGGISRPNRYRRLPGLLRNIASKFAVSAEHFNTLWCAHRPGRVEIDLLTGRIGPAAFAIDRNENLAAMCRDALKRNLESLELTVGEARLVLLPSDRPAWDGFRIVIEASLADGRRSFRIDYQ
jgi:hypothetical protein